MWAAYRRPRAPSIPFLFCFDLLCIASRRAHVQGAAENTHRNERACPPFLGGDSIRRSGASAAAGKAGVGVAHPPRSVCTSSPPFAAPLCQPPPCASAVFCLASTAGLSALGPLMSGQSRHRAGGGGTAPTPVIGLKVTLAETGAPAPRRRRGLGKAAGTVCARRCPTRGCSRCCPAAARWC